MRVEVVILLINQLFVIEKLWGVAACPSFHARTHLTQVKQQLRNGSGMSFVTTHTHKYPNFQSTTSNCLLCQDLKEVTGNLGGLVEAGIIYQL